MTRRPVGGSPSAAGATEHLAGWERLLCSWGILVLLMLPLSVLQQIDALLVFSRPADVLTDFALLALLCGAPALALTLVAGVLQRGLAPLMPDARRRSLLADVLVIAPALWVLLWQLSRISWLWFKQATGHEFLVSPTLRYAAMAGFALLLLQGWRLLRQQRLRQRILENLRALRWPTAIVLAACLSLLLIRPPQYASEDPSLGRAPAANSPDVILITLDALSAIDAQVCGDGPTLMPRLRAFAAGASCFTHLYAASNFTTPTTSSLETGTLPWSHLATQISAKVAPPYQAHTLAQALRQAGYATFTTTDNQLASVRQRATQSGYMKHAITPSRLLRDRLRAALTLWPQSSVPMLVDNTLSFLGAFDTHWHSTANPFGSQAVLSQAPQLLETAGGARPAFVWVHSMPPHSPYLPPASTKYKLLPPGELERWSDFMGDNLPYASEQQGRVDKHRLRYRESIMATDIALGELLDELSRSGRLHNALLLISADHGESFEKGFLGHAGPKLHEALLRIPLIVKMPGQTQGRIVSTPVSQVDIAPSVLDALGLPPLPRAEGRSIAASWRGEALSGQTVFSMSMERQSRFLPLQLGHYAVVEGSRKLIVDLQQPQAARLYDLAVDPTESTDIAARQPEDVRRMRDLLARRLAAAEAQRREWAPQ